MTILLLGAFLRRALVVYTGVDRGVHPRRSGGGRNRPGTIGVARGTSGAVVILSEAKDLRDPVRPSTEVGGGGGGGGGGEGPAPAPPRGGGSTEANIRLPMMLTPVRLNVSSIIRLASPVSPLSPSLSISRKRTSARSTTAMKPSSDIDTLKKTLLMMCDVMV
jgi:hypothetical protein